jgi:glycosyltransferase involved in cell wall biosynthesis
LKFWRLYKKHIGIKDDYDVMIVGYPSQIVVPLAKLISSKKVVLDALCSLYEGEIISRRSGDIWSFRAIKTWLIDFLAYFFADLVLVETNAQIDFFAKTFFVSKNKIIRVFTGALDTVFFPDPSVKKRANFTAVFRGQFLPEAGVETILESAKILESSGVQFLFIGKDFGQKKLAEKIANLNLKNVSIISGFLPQDEIRSLMLSCHVSLGQFANHPRIQRTIPHKAFETLALGLPYITGRAGGVLELLTDGENCLMVNLADPKDLAYKILELKNNPALADQISKAGLKLFQNNLKPKILSGQIIKFIT